MSAQNSRGGAGDGHRVRIASLEDLAAIMVLTNRMLTCGYPATEDSSDCDRPLVAVRTGTQGAR